MFAAAPAAAYGAIQRPAVRESEALGIPREQTRREGAGAPLFRSSHELMERLPLAQPLPTVQREETSETRGTITGATTDETKEEEAISLDRLDLDLLADRLWGKLRYRLRVERERSRGWT